jgi:porin
MRCGNSSTFITRQATRRTTGLSFVFFLATTVAVIAADPSPPPTTAIPYAGPQTLTGDWFGQGQAMRNAGIDFRLEWSEFYQGMTQGARTIGEAL